MTFKYIRIRCLKMSVLNVMFLLSGGCTGLCCFSHSFVLSHSQFVSLPSQWETVSHPFNKSKIMALHFLFSKTSYKRQRTIKGSKVNGVNASAASTIPDNISRTSLSTIKIRLIGVNLVCSLVGLSYDPRWIECGTNITSHNPPLTQNPLNTLAHTATQTRL
jgi:hypothetical protein